jgi:hypothetical protein
MKTSNNNILTAISKTDLNNLTEQVKETVAIHMNDHITAKANFSAAGLWNIQRMRKARTQRRFLMAS